ncbi:glycosyltransferase [Novosphingobium huizhouense]|uniref:glycosyltransferase n=1 Tax=Novosphingobium huizhouense TaxID=2866625 RepID=UPI001CD907F7|nr:glycosyltransferase [Novosphingobium huizhouense]
MKRRLLSISTLFPAPQRPAFGRFVARQASALAARGDWDVTVLNPIGLPPVRLQRYRSLEAIPAQEQVDGVDVHHPRFPLLPGLSGPFNAALIARALLPLARSLHAERRFDLIDAQFFYPDGPAAARLAAALGLPLAIKARGSDIHYWGTRASALRQMRKAACAASAVLAVSAALGRDMAALGLAPRGVRVHYTGLDHRRFTPLPRAAARQRVSTIPGLGISPEGRMIVCVGALLAIKGQDLAIRALPHLPDDVRLVLAGEGAEEATLRALAERSGVAARVRFLGSVGHEHLPALLSAADVMVLPSEREGLANAWIEALACGTPVVIADIGGAREVVTSPAAGRIVARTPEAIAEGVRSLLEAPPSQAEVAATVARFSWEANAAALAEIYDEIA